jgi:enoyl-CoA hydratase
VSEKPVLASIAGRSGRIVLNRPEAINALNTEMVGLIQDALNDWRHDPRVQTIVLTGAGERGLCAGGDIVSIYADTISDEPAETTASAEFWRDEYTMNAAIAGYPLPFVAVMDGIVLGGGVGVSAHASHRIVTERSSVAMPETSIGFAPDVGGTWLLSHSPGELGTHVALTAGTVGAGDAITLGLADRYVPTSSLPGLIEALATQDADAAIAAVAEPAPASELRTHQSWIDDCYAHDDVTSIIDALRAHPEPEAKRAADLIERRSPTAVATALRALRAARTMTLAQALRQELRMVVRFLDTPDFAEGVRAAVIDKDRRPRWSPASLAEVTDADVDRFFEPLTNDLDLDHDQTTVPAAPGGNS